MSLVQPPDPRIGDGLFHLGLLGGQSGRLGAVGTTPGSVGGNQLLPSLTPDGAQGAFAAWSDCRGVGRSHIFAQHVLASGAVDPAWPVDGTAISAGNVLETRPIAVSDGAGGAVVTWQGFTVHLNMYAQHVKATGVVDPAWAPGGRARG